jgi:hypothetical protein
VRIVEEEAAKQKFFDALMSKYRAGETTRPKSFYPRIDHIILYALEIERLTGKEVVLPDISGQWPALDRTKTPNARPPSS